MDKVILVIIDGLSYRMKKYMGYLEALCEDKKAQCHCVKSKLPTLSKPLYNMLLTGVSPIKSGIRSNNIKGKSKDESIFDLAVKNGKKTGAAAYYWIEELYNSGSFDPIKNMEVENKDLPINFGRFYWEDNFPDSHVFIQGERLRIKYDVDFLVIHSMNVDDSGHKHGVLSNEYRKSILKVSDILAIHLPKWIEENYQIIITSDHGMDIYGNHGGTTKLESYVPMWLIGDKFENLKLDDYLSQDIVFLLCCKGLGIEKS